MEDEQRAGRRRALELRRASPEAVRIRDETEVDEAVGLRGEGRKSGTVHEVPWVASTRPFTRNCDTLPHVCAERDTRGVRPVGSIRSHAGPRRALVPKPDHVQG